MGRVFYVVCLFALLAWRAAGASPLKVLTLNFNSEQVPVDDSHVVRDRRFAAMADWVNRNDPDLLLLQEGWNYGDDSSVAVTLARVLGYDVAYRLDMGFPGYMYDSDAVLAKKSLRLSGQKNLKLPHSALDIGDGKSWIIVTGAVSYAVGVRLTLPGGEPIYAYSTHLVASSEADRRDQLASLNSALQKRVSEEGGDWSTAKVILGGDFNSGPKAPGPLFMRAQGYQDTWLSAHASEAADPGFTNCMQWWTACYNPFTLGSGQFPEQDLPDPDTRIDYIYTHGKGMTVRSSAVEFTSPYDGVWMSDHYGVVSTIGVDEGADAIAVANVPPQSALPPPAFLNVTEDLFECDDWRYGCRATLAETVVEGSRGLTIRDGTKGELNIHIRGPGRVFTSPDAQLSDGQYASFVFDRAGIYTLKMDDGDEDRIVGRIRVQKGLAE